MSLRDSGYRSEVETVGVFSYIPTNLDGVWQFPKRNLRLLFLFTIGSLLKR